MALKKTLYNAGLFLTDNRKPAHRDSGTNFNDIIHYIISPTAIFNNNQNLTLSNNISSDHSHILLIIKQIFKRYMPAPIKV